MPLPQAVGIAAFGRRAELIEALQEIKNHIVLPFNPQASDLVLDGQVTDALSRMDVSFLQHAYTAYPGGGAAHDVDETALRPADGRNGESVDSDAWWQPRCAIR